MSADDAEEEAPGVSTVLSQDTYTLKELLLAPDLLACCHGHELLLEYISSEDGVRGLVDTALGEEEQLAVTAATLLCGDYGRIVEVLADSQDHLIRMFSEFTRPVGEANTLVVQCASGIGSLLLEKVPLAVLEAFRQIDGVVPGLICHINSCFLFLKALMLFKNPAFHTTWATPFQHNMNTTDVPLLQWLAEEDIMRQLIACLESTSADTRDNAAHILGAVLDASMEAPVQNMTMDDNSDWPPPVPFLYQAFSEETAAQLVAIATSADRSTMQECMTVLVTLLDLHFAVATEATWVHPSVQNMIRNKEYVPPLHTAVLRSLEQFQDLLPLYDLTGPMSAEFPCFKNPCGHWRLQRLQLIAHLVCGLAVYKTPEELAAKLPPSVVLDAVSLLRAFPWNNFVHSWVVRTLRGALELPEEHPLGAVVRGNELRTALLDAAVLSGEAESGALYGPGKRMRLGYMGHVNDMINALVETPRSLEFLSSEVRERWEEYVASTLVKDNQTNDTPIAFAEPPMPFANVPADEEVSELSAIALYDFDAPEEGDLAFPAAAVITNVSRVSDDPNEFTWLYGNYKGKRGMFPSKWVQLCTAAEGVASDSGVRARALFDFIGNSESGDELSFKAGEVISGVVPAESDWLSGELGGVRGVFPCSYVELEGAALSDNGVHDDNDGQMDAGDIAAPDLSDDDDCADVVEAVDDDDSDDTWPFRPAVSAFKAVLPAGVEVVFGA